MKDSAQSFNTSQSYDLAIRTLDLLEKVLHEINMAYAPEDYRKLIEQSNREGSFQ
jgi:capsular polysaccharide biosynthesis protein